MKNLLKICTAVLAVSMVAVVCSACACGEEKGGVIENQFGTYYQNIDTIVTYKLDNQNVNTKVDEKKSLALQGVLNKCEEVEKKPECEFSKNFMVSYQNKEYLIAHDGCNHVKYEGKYYRIPVSDRMILNDIFENYGAEVKNQEINEKHEVKVKNK